MLVLTLATVMNGNTGYISYPNISGKNESNLQNNNLIMQTVRICGFKNLLACLNTGRKFEAPGIMKMILINCYKEIYVAFFCCVKIQFRIEIIVTTLLHSDKHILPYMQYY